MLAIAAAKRAPPTRSRGRHSADEEIIPSLPSYEEWYQTVAFKDSLADHLDSDSINSSDSPNAPPYEMDHPTRAQAFQSPFKLSASRTSAREANDKKGSNSNIIKKKKKEDELFIPNALEMENKFKVACSVAALLMFFHFKEKTIRGNAFEDCDTYRPAPLSDMWKNILLKQPAEKLSIALHTILTHQEVRLSALGGVPPFRQNTFLTGTLMVLPLRDSPQFVGNEVLFHLLPRTPPAPIIRKQTNDPRQRYQTRTGSRDAQSPDLVSGVGD
jgi:hypothetical protein